MSGDCSSWLGDYYNVHPGTWMYPEIITLDDEVRHTWNRTGAAAHSYTERDTHH